MNLLTAFLFACSQFFKKEVATDKLQEQADLALYKAKARGRNQICSNVGQ